LCRKVVQRFLYAACVRSSAEVRIGVSAMVFEKVVDQSLYLPSKEVVEMKCRVQNLVGFICRVRRSRHASVMLLRYPPRESGRQGALSSCCNKARSTSGDLPWTTATSVTSSTGQLSVPCFPIQQLVPPFSKLCEIPSMSRLARVSREWKAEKVFCSYSYHTTLYGIASAC
jgi:hypothetical protein